MMAIRESQRNMITCPLVGELEKTGVGCQSLFCSGVPEMDGGQSLPMLPAETQRLRP